MKNEQILAILLVVFGVIVAVLIPMFIDGMEVIGPILSVVLFLLVIPLIYYSRRKNA